MAKAISVNKWLVAGVAGAIAWLCIHRKKGKVAGIGYIDRDAVREILLWYENTEHLYRYYHVPIVNSLVKKLEKGMLLSEDYLAKSSVVDNIVRETLRDYARSFGSFPVDTETRKEMKREIAHSIMLSAQDEYEYLQENK